MGLENRGLFIPYETPPPNFGHFWVVLEGWSQILPSTKLFHHVFEQNCSAMATQNLEEEAQQHNKLVESSKTGCRSQSRAHGKAYEQVPALSRGAILQIESKIAPPNIWGTNLNCSRKFHHPSP